MRCKEHKGGLALQFSFEIKRTKIYHLLAK
jgi:hypothetical protein